MQSPDCHQPVDCTTSTTVDNFFKQEGYPNMTFRANAQNCWIDR